MIKTETGYKIVLTASPIDSLKSIPDSVKSVTNFFDEMQNEGIWYAVTGEHFKDWIVNAMKEVAQSLVNASDYIIIASLLILLLVIFGSNRAKKWLYWSVCIYLMFQILGMML